MYDESRIRDLTDFISDETIQSTPEIDHNILKVILANLFEMERDNIKKALLAGVLLLLDQDENFTDYQRRVLILSCYTYSTQKRAENN